MTFVSQHSTSNNSLQNLNEYWEKRYKTSAKYCYICTELVIFHHYLTISTVKMLGKKKKVKQHVLINQTAVD